MQNALLITAIGLAQSLVILLLLWGLAFWLARPSRQPARTIPAGATPMASVPVNRLVVAPIAGEVAELRVGPGDAVTFGQALCLIAGRDQKMLVRAAQVGHVAAIAVSPGEPVTRGQTLLELSE